MKFIVKLVSVQHPVLIPTGALLNAHHPFSLPPPTPHQPSVYSQHLSVSYGLPPSLSVTFFPPSPPPLSSVKFLRIHIRVKTYGICLCLYDLFHYSSTLNNNHYAVAVTVEIAGRLDKSNLCFSLSKVLCPDGDNVEYLALKSNP